MSLNLNKRFRILTSLLMVCVVAQIIVNSTLFIHFHFNPQGKLVAHSHPYPLSSSTEGSGESHHHTNYDFVCIDSLSVLIYQSLTPCHLVYTSKANSLLLDQQIFLDSISDSSTPSRAPPIA